jgi:hypothetical protein
LWLSVIADAGSRFRIQVCPRIWAKIEKVLLFRLRTYTVPTCIKNRKIGLVAKEDPCTFFTIAFILLRAKNNLDAFKNWEVDYSIHSFFHIFLSDIRVHFPSPFPVVPLTLKEGKRSFPSLFETRVFFSFFSFLNHARICNFRFVQQKKCASQKCFHRPQC